VYERGSGDAGRSVDPPNDLPQLSQNFCFAGFAFPQKGQLSVLAKGAAHSPQKLGISRIFEPAAYAPHRRALRRPEPRDRRPGGQLRAGDGDRVSQTMKDVRVINT
jgi:hypothetical protein